MILAKATACAPPLLASLYDTVNDVLVQIMIVIQRKCLHTLGSTWIP